MKLTVALEQNGRTACEQLIIADDTRREFREAMNSAAARMELSTYGPPGPVEEMTAEDRPAGSRDG